MDIVNQLFASICENKVSGGGTININEYGNYVVGGLVPSLTMDVHTPPADMLDNIANWLETNWNHLSDADSVGWWVDDETLYIDMNTHYENKYMARQFGIMRGELAIWDIAAGRDIRLDNN